jgi:hypothetical protein
VRAENKQGNEAGEVLIPTHRMVNKSEKNSLFRVKALPWMTHSWVVCARSFVHSLEYCEGEEVRRGRDGERQFCVRFIYVEGPVVDNPQPRIDDHDRARVRPLPNNETSISSALHMMSYLGSLLACGSPWPTRKGKSPNSVIFPYPSQD